MYKLFRRILFLLPAEASHDLALFSLSITNKIGLLNLLASTPTQTPVTVMGIEFPNKVGLAAGLDKNGKYIHALSKFGFGFIEVGTVTPKSNQETLSLVYLEFLKHTPSSIAWGLIIMVSILLFKM